MSAFGPKRHEPLHCTRPLSGVKRTWLGRIAISAFDPMRTLGVFQAPSRSLLCACPSFGGGNEAARVHQATTWPLATYAQQAGQSRQIGFLYPDPQAVAPSRVANFLTGLEAGGLPAEKVIVVPRVTGGDPALLDRMAVDLARKVDLIFAIGPAAARAAHAATTSIPIVAGDLESDPTSTGRISDLSALVKSIRTLAASQFERSRPKDVQSTKQKS